MMLVVKLGGSVITVKDRPYTPRHDIIRGYARVIRELMEAGHEMLIVLGGGSFGHYEVKRCMERGVSPTMLVSRVSRAMNILALIVASIFEQEGLATVIHAPHTFCEPRGLKPGCDWRVARKAIESGLLPLTYGDIVAVGNGYHIISGDELAAEAGCALGADLVVYATSVPGVLLGGRVVERLTRDSLGSVLGLVGGSKSDVTGGMRRKLEALLEAGCSGLRAVIVDGREPSILGSVGGGDVRGTLVEL